MAITPALVTFSDKTNSLLIVQHAPTVTDVAKTTQEVPAVSDISEHSFEKARHSEYSARDVVAMVVIDASPDPSFPKSNDAVPQRKPHTHHDSPTPIANDQLLHGQEGSPSAATSSTEDVVMSSPLREIANEPARHLQNSQLSQPQVQVPLTVVDAPTTTASQEVVPPTVVNDDTCEQRPPHLKPSTTDVAFSQQTQPSPPSLPMPIDEAARVLSAIPIVARERTSDIINRLNKSVHVDPPLRIKNPRLPVASHEALDELEANIPNVPLRLRVPQLFYINAVRPQLPKRIQPRASTRIKARLAKSSEKEATVGPSVVNSTITETGRVLRSGSVKPNATKQPLIGKFPISEGPHEVVHARKRKRQN